MRRLLGFGLLWILAFSACTSGGSPGPGMEPDLSDTAQQGEVPTSPTTERVSPVGTSTGEATTVFDGRRMSVRLRVKPSRVTEGEAPEALLVNNGEHELGYGPGFKIERRSGDGWRWVNRRQAFPLPLFYLSAGERSERESLAVYFNQPEPVELRPGLYRVTKTVVLTPGRPHPPTMKVSAQFQVISR